MFSAGMPSIHYPHGKMIQSPFVSEGKRWQRKIHSATLWTCVLLQNEKHHSQIGSTVREDTCFAEIGGIPKSWGYRDTPIVNILLSIYYIYHILSHILSSIYHLYIHNKSHGWPDNHHGIHSKRTGPNPSWIRHVHPSTWHSVLKRRWPRRAQTSPCHGCVVEGRWATLGLMWVVPQVVVSPSSGTFLAQKTRLETASSENWRVTSSCGKHQSFRKLGASSPPVGLRMS